MAQQPPPPVFADAREEFNRLVEQGVIAFGMLAIVLQGVVFAYFFPLFYRHRGGGSPVVMNPDIRARYKELQEAIISRGGV